MRFIGVEVEQEKSAPPPGKKSWIRPCICTVFSMFNVALAHVDYVQDICYRNQAKFCFF